MQSAGSDEDNDDDDGDNNDEERVEDEPANRTSESTEVLEGSTPGWPARVFQDISTHIFTEKSKIIITDTAINVIRACTLLKDCKKVVDLLAKDSNCAEISPVILPVIWRQAYLFLVHRRLHTNSIHLILKHTSKVVS